MLMMVPSLPETLILVIRLTRNFRIGHNPSMIRKASLQRTLT